MNNSSKIYEQRINRVIDYVNNNLDKSISLEELASVSHFSPYHFHRIFTAVTGESVNDFTSRLRLEKASKLLRYTANPISDIAYECGFSSPSTLSRSFKQYFDTSPSAYRKSGKIDNSKIRKDLFPVNQYHCDMDEAELRNRFPVEIKEFPSRRIAYMRITNSFEDGVVLKALGEMVDWAKRMDLFDTETIFSMSKDDPTVTPKDKYIYYVCITIPEEFKMDQEHYLDSRILPKCNYAVTTVSGDFNEAATAINYLFSTWLINSDYEPEHEPGLEIFRDKENICNWSHFDLDLCIPVKEIKTM